MANIRSLGDFKNAEPHDNQGTSNYTGGEHSGLNVLNPGSARDTQWQTAVPPDPQQQIDHRVTLYSNGFMLDNGDFRSFDNPDNRKFVKDLEAGEVPKELKASKSSKYVAVEDKSSVAFENDAQFSASKLFTGTPMRLSQVSSTTSPANISVDTSRSIHVIDSSKPVTTLQIRFPTGERKRVQFNEDHTISDLHDYLLQITHAEGGYKILEGFPPKEISSVSTLTLKEAGLLNTTLTYTLC